MLVEAPCPRCKTTVSFDASFAGTKRTCRSCGASFVLEKPTQKPQPKAFTPKRDRSIIFETTCGQCQHTYAIDAAFAGSPRTCPKCGHLAVLQLPDAVRAQVEARKDRLYGAPAREHFGCPACLRFGSAARPEALFRCQYCATATPVEQASAFATKLESLESNITAKLLSGAAAGELIAGADAKLIQTLIERVHPKLGRIRSRALAARNRGENVVLKPPPCCDACFAAGPLSPLSLLWSRIEEQTTNVHAATALTIFSGVVVTQKNRVISNVEEITYLCEACRRRPRPPELRYTLEKAFALPPL